MNICIFGDSITWGASDYEKGGWVERLKMHCMTNFDDVHVYNLGMCGQNTGDILKRLENEARVREPEIILIAIGINDSQYLGAKENHRVSVDQFKRNLIDLIGISQKITDKVVLVGLTRVDESKTTPIPWNVEKFYDNESIDRYDAVIQDLCKEKGSQYIEMKDVVGIVDLEDGLHPNPVGHEKMFRVILGAVSKNISDIETKLTI